MKTFVFEEQWNEPALRIKQDSTTQHPIVACIHLERKTKTFLFNYTNVVLITLSQYLFHSAISFHVIRKHRRKNLKRQKKKS